MSPTQAPPTRTNPSDPSLTGKMRAITQTAYGAPDILDHANADRPVPADNEVLVRVRAASVCKGDVHVLTGKPYLIRLMGYGLLRPNNTVPGQNLAGHVEAVGKDVTAFGPGDAVYGQAHHGAFAEYVRVGADRLAPKPANLDFEQAAAVPDSGLTALQALRDVGGLQPGQRVLVNGASGGVGTFAVQIAKALGAAVTAVCSTRHVDAVRSLGADRVVDYTREDFARLEARHDILLDLVGNRSLRDCKRALKPRGVFVSCAGSPGDDWIGPVVWMLKVVLAGAFSSQKMAPFIMKPNQSDLVFLKQLIEGGAVTPLIERRYPLAQAAAAIGHIAAGHAQGKTVLTV